MVLCLRKGFPLSVAVFRKIFQCYNSALATPGWVYIRQRPKSPHIFNGSSIPDNNPQWRDTFVGLKWEGGDWGTLFRRSFGKVSDWSAKTITLSPEEMIIYDELIKDNGQTVSQMLLEEFSLIHAGLSTVSVKGIFPFFFLLCFCFRSIIALYLRVYLLSQRRLLSMLQPYRLLRRQRGWRRLG